MILEINGKEYPLEWGMSAIEMYCDMFDCDITDIDMHLTSEKIITKLKAINNLTLCAIKNGCENSIPQKNFDITIHDFQKWKDMQPVTVSDAIVNDWKKSYLFGKTVSEYFFGEVSDHEIKTGSKKKQV